MREISNRGPRKSADLIVHVDISCKSPDVDNVAYAWVTGNNHRSSIFRGRSRDRRTPSVPRFRPSAWRRRICFGRNDDLRGFSLETNGCRQRVPVLFVPPLEYCRSIALFRTVFCPVSFRCTDASSPQKTLRISSNDASSDHNSHASFIDRILNLVINSRLSFFFEDMALCPLFFSLLVSRLPNSQSDTLNLSISDKIRSRHLRVLTPYSLKHITYFFK